MSSTSKTTCNLVKQNDIFSESVNYTCHCHLVLWLSTPADISYFPPRHFSKTWTSYTPDSLIDRRIWNLSTKPSQLSFTLADNYFTHSVCAMLFLFTGTCAINRYRCEGGNKCIPLKWICDGVHDCDDKLDERNCFTGKETNIPLYSKLRSHNHRSL